MTNKLDQLQGIIDDMIAMLPDDLESNVWCNITAEANEAQKILSEMIADQHDYLPVIRLHRSEVAMFAHDDGVSDNDFEAVASKLGEALMNGYWDTLKQVVEEYVEPSPTCEICGKPCEYDPEVCVCKECEEKAK
jgi:hypothetical protein